MRSTSLIARSVAPRSSAPASDVTNPPSNAASTAWPSTLPKSNRSALHCVGIGALLESMKLRCGTTTFADSEPRCDQWCEKCGLAVALLRAFPLFALAQIIVGGAHIGPRRRAMGIEIILDRGGGAAVLAHFERFEAL